MKDLGEASYILGMKIYRDKSTRLLELSQSMYIDTVLKWFSIKNFKKGYLSISQKIFLSKNDCLTTSREREHINKISYALIVRSIMYITICTKLNVVYPLGVVSRYQSDPGENY